MVEDICKNPYEEYVSWGAALESADFSYRGVTLEVPPEELHSSLKSGFDKLSDAFGKTAGEQTCFRVGMSIDLIPSVVVGVNDVKLLGHKGNLRIGMEPHRTNYHPSDDTRIIGDHNQSLFRDVHTDITKGDEFHIEFGGGDKRGRLTSNIEGGVAFASGKTQLYSGGSVSWEGKDNTTILVGANLNYDSDHGFENSILIKGDLDVNGYNVAGTYQRTEGGDRIGVSSSHSVTVSKSDGDNYKYISGATFEHNGESGNNIEGGLCKEFSKARVCAVVGHGTGGLDNPGITAGGDNGLYTGFRLLDTKF